MIIRVCIFLNHLAIRHLRIFLFQLNHLCKNILQFHLIVLIHSTSLLWKKEHIRYLMYYWDIYISNNQRSKLLETKKVLPIAGMTDKSGNAMELTRLIHPFLSISICQVQGGRSMWYTITISTFLWSSICGIIHSRAWIILVISKLV